MFKILKGVVYDNGDPGAAFGGGIYNMSCTIGTTSDPTKVTLNVASPNGVYNISPGILNVTSSGKKNIKIGDAANLITFHRLYVYKYNFNESAGQKVLSVSLVDQSAAFDKIFIGLTARHAPINGAWTVGSPETFDFDVRCLECNTLWPSFQTASGTVQRTLLKPLGTGLTSVNGGDGTIDGGFAIIGQESWTDGNCEIPKVEYTFAELCNTISAMGIGHNLLHHNRSSHYTAAYVGTLREVLSSWAADFSFSYTIDPTDIALNIVATDLTAPLGLQQIRSALTANNFGKGNADKALVRSKSETYSLEGTYRQEPIVKSIKPARSFSRQQTSYTQVTGKPVTVYDAVGVEANLGRTDDQLDVCIALAKYQPQARLIWLSDEAAKATINAGPGGQVGGTNGGNVANTNPFPALGFIPAPNGHITDVVAKEHLVDMFAQSSTGGSVFQHPVWKDPDNYNIFVGVYNSEDQAYCEAYDKELSEFLGKYAYWHGQSWSNNVFSGGSGLTNPPPSTRDCPLTGWNPATQHRYYDLTSQISTLPDSKPYKLNSFPFQNILRTNDGVFSLLGMTAGNPPVPVGADPDGDFIFSLEDNAWGTNQQHIDNAFYNQWVYVESDAADWGSGRGKSVTDLEHYLPIYARFSSDRILGGHLRQIIPNFDLDFIAADDRTKGYFPGIAIIPKVDKMMATDALSGASSRVLEVDYNSSPNYPNAKVYDSTRRRALQMVGQSAKECKIFCEEDIVSDICECPDIPDPLHKFSSFNSKTLTLKHVGNEAVIVFPVLSDYQGYWKGEQVFRGTYPKQIDILGSPPLAPIGNVMETRVIDQDVTNGLNPSPTSSGFEQKFIVRGALHTGAITLTDYYGELAAMNQSLHNLPTETINVKIDGLDFGSLYPFLNPQSGMSSFNVSVDAEGMSTDLTFNSRQAKMPKRDIFTQKLNAVSAGRHLSPVSHSSHGGVGLPFNP